MRSFDSYYEYPEESRKGRQKQVYDGNVRQIVGCIAIEPNTKEIVVISSSKHENVWILPKGGWENDETKEEAAARETYEEAGIRGPIKKFLGSYIDYDDSGEPKSKMWFYEMQVRQILTRWPEGDFRERKFCTFEEAMELLKLKPNMQLALTATSVAAKQNAEEQCLEDKNLEERNPEEQDQEEQDQAEQDQAEQDQARKNP